MSRRQARGWMGVALMWLCTAAVFTAAPAFHVVELGNGAPVDVNSSGTVIGVDSTSLTARPWLVDSSVRTYLPLPPGATSALVSRVSNTGVVVGHVNGQPLLWTKESGTYRVSVLPLPTGATGGLPVAVNASGDVLINYGTPTIYNGYPYFSSVRPFLYTASGQLVDLARQYGLAESPSVTDMTDGGRILTSFGMILEPDLATTTPAPAPPPGWTNYSAARLNEQGAFVAKGYMSTSDGHAALGRYVPGRGWLVIHAMIGAMYPASADGIDEQGNVTCTAFGGPSLTTADGRTLALGDLLLNGPYGFGSSGTAMSDAGHVVTLARNTAGATAAVLLEPSGTLPAPDPVVLTGVAHPATSSAPWDAISLTWTASARAKAYVVERKGPTDAEFVALTPASGTIQLKYDDTSIALVTSYTYRVIPIGVGGNGPASNEVTVVSPPPKDGVAPTARITSPPSGSAVGGVVTVVAEASDNVGLRGFEIRYQPNQGSEVLCARSYAQPRPSDTLSCTWDPRYLPSGATAQLIAFAYDDIGNYVQNPISVTYQPSSTPDTQPPAVTVISPGRNETVSGIVKVSARATDNVGVVRMELSDSRGVLLKTVNAAELTYDWNTAGLKKGSTQTLLVRAHDARGNGGSAKVSVRIQR